jgi:YfiH family protein
VCPVVDLPFEERGGLRVMTLPHFKALGVDAFFTTRHGGVSDGAYASLNLGGHVGDEPTKVAENLWRVASAIATERIHRVSQVHGADVIDVHHITDSTKADAILCHDHDVTVAVLVADCTPLLIVDEGSHQLCVVHAGWRGLASGVIEAAVLAMGVNPTALHVAIGPAISGDRYQVGPEVIAASSHFAPNARPDLGDRWLLDTRATAVSILKSVGVREANITMSSATTDGGELFFSDRTERPCGRFALVAKWQS